MGCAASHPIKSHTIGWISVMHTPASCWILNGIFFLRIPLSRLQKGSSWLHLCPRTIRWNSSSTLFWTGSCTFQGRFGITSRLLCLFWKWHVRLCGKSNLGSSSCELRPSKLSWPHRHPLHRINRWFSCNLTLQMSCFCVSSIFRLDFCRLCWKAWSSRFYACLLLWSSSTHLEPVCRKFIWQFLFLLHLTTPLPWNGFHRLLAWWLKRFGPEHCWIFFVFQTPDGFSPHLTHDHHHLNLDSRWV